jgi:hypothetical protein
MYMAVYFNHYTQHIFFCVCVFIVFYFSFMEYNTLQLAYIEFLLFSS